LNVLDLLIVAIPAVFAVTVHEVAHGWVANRLGDPTAAQMGRLTLNPLRHIDPIGSVLVPVALKLLGAPFLFGWAKPVPVNFRNLHHLPRDIALVAAAGPASNLLMLCGWTAVLAVGGHSPLWREMGWTGVLFNATIMTLNLVPIPPLDGSRIVSAMLPRRAAVLYGRLERVGLFLTLLLVASGALGVVLKPVLVGIARIVSRLVA
jgi:Zn-dependent protease